MKIKILESAIEDIVNGYIFYENQEVGIGRYFTDSIYSDIDSLLVFAGIHSVHFGKFRMLSKHFPYAIYYSVKGESVIVHAVLDCRLKPSSINKRIR